MAQFQLTIKDAAFAPILATFDGADDAAKLTELKRWVKGQLRDHARGVQIRAAQEAANAALRAMLETLDTTLAD